ncbi:hypothetical protein DL764_003899 [Monosporascus ibericus]|uniref:Zn(2)-C6 fungal-type domain-containing protein n=1 Tax=Monosporascus ibericus TaxID=155417 RepID=A0A4Q4TET2_9PEZI|nr:hypothetical protein DL764_003899 [Monosporascus ibericus]
MEGPKYSQSQSTVAAASYRKRAYASKVRTGCITWIRKIKCDEKKPACVRCTSTGRRCDGYGGPVVHPNPSPWAKAVDALGPTVRILRSVTADVVGTHAERWYFHRFCSAAARGFALHTTNLGSFWSVLVPQVAHHDVAVKHAVVALGSAFHMHDRRLEKGDAQRLEVFVVTQYNEAIRSLRRHMASASSEDMEITLVCCLMFAFLEIIRSNSEAALVHFAHGRRILDTLPVSVCSYLRAPPSYGEPPPPREQQRQRECGPIVRQISKAEWRQLLAFFAELEFMSHMHGAGVAAANGGDLLGNLVGPPPPPSSSSHHVTTAAAAAGGSEPDPDSSAAASWQDFPEAVVALGDEYEDEDYDYMKLDECHHQFFAWALRVFARVVETLPHKGDAAFWADPEQRRLHSTLVERGRRVLRSMDRLDIARGSRRSSASAASSAEERGGGGARQARVERVSLLGDRLHGRGTFFILLCMPHNYTRRQIMARFDALFREFMDMSEELAGFLLESSSSDSGTGPGKNNKKIDTAFPAAAARKEKEEELRLPAITLDNGVLIALHVVLYGTGSRDLRRRAMRVLRRLGNRREGMYDATAILRVFAGIGAKGEDGWDDAEDPLLDEPVGPSLTGLGGLPGLERRLAAVKLAGGKRTGEDGTSEVSGDGWTGASRDKAI